MAAKVRAACVQVTSTPDMPANIDAACIAVRQASASGAEFVLLPENIALLADGGAMRDTAFDAGVHPARRAFADVARETKTWLLAGSIAERVEDGRLANRSLLIDPAGRTLAEYDKIHMFDVALGDGENYRESETYRPGNEAVVAATPWGALGMTICYDMRFPHLYRALAQAGAVMLSVPSAFTVPTGRAHWHVLLRARAIESGCFIFAPAQCGTHYGKRRTYGHSLIVDPWGEILAEAGDGPAVITADIDLSAVEAVRTKVPSLAHDRPYARPRLSRAHEAAE